MPNRESNKTAGAKGAARQDVSRYRELREAMGWSRETAAAELGMPASTIRFYEKNGLIPNQQRSSDGRLIKAKCRINRY